jgi:flavin reductase (DIM6/NTAB) family NADH-FMN oxidoreductase RutF
MLLGRFYGVSVLGEGQVALSDHFAGRGGEKLDIPFITKRGMPLLDGVVAHLIFELVQIVPAGDHKLVIGRVVYLDWVDDLKPLLFYAGQYRHLEKEELAHPDMPEDELSLFSIGNF